MRRPKVKKIEQWMFKYAKAKAKAEGRTPLQVSESFEDCPVSYRFNSGS